MVRSGFVPATEASLPTPRKAGTQAQGGGAHLYHIVCMTFCKSLCLSAPMAAVCGIQGPVWPDGGSSPPFMSCHQFAGLSPGHSLASSRLSSPLLNGQLSGLPGSTARIWPSRLALGKRLRETLDQRPCPEAKSQVRNAEGPEALGPRSQTTPEHLPQAWIRMPQLYRTHVESRDHKCFAHYWGQCGLGWQRLRTQEFVSCAKPLAYLLLCLCSRCPSFTGTQPLWSPFQNSWPLWPSTWTRGL